MFCVPHPTVHVFLSRQATPRSCVSRSAWNASTRKSLRTCSSWSRRCLTSRKVVLVRLKSVLFYIHRVVPEHTAAFVIDVNLDTLESLSVFKKKYLLEPFLMLCVLQARPESFSFKTYPYPLHFPVCLAKDIPTSFKVCFQEKFWLVQKFQMPVFSVIAPTHFLSTCYHRETHVRKTSEVGSVGTLATEWRAFQIF